MQLLWQRFRHMLAPLAGSDQSVNFTVNAVLKDLHRAGISCWHGAAPFAMQINAGGLPRETAAGFLVNQQQIALRTVRRQAVRKA